MCQLMCPSQAVHVWLSLTSWSGTHCLCSSPIPFTLRRSRRHLVMTSLAVCLPIPSTRLPRGVPGRHPRPARVRGVPGNGGPPAPPDRPPATSRWPRPARRSGGRPAKAARTFCHVRTSSFGAGCCLGGGGTLKPRRPAWRPERVRWRKTPVLG